MKFTSSKYLLLPMILLLMAMHLPFMQADPGTEVDVHTRGAWTDEGTYSAQGRNFVTTGKLDLHENVTFIRGPFFGILQIPFFYAFGSHLEVARAITLLLLLLLLLIFLKDDKLSWLLLFLIPVVFMQYHIFAFSHYAMAEMICLIYVLFAMYFAFLSGNNSRGSKNKYLFISSVFLFLSYASKIQYIYVAGIMPLALFLQYLFSFSARDINRKAIFSSFSLSVFFALILFSVYLLAWYLPNADFYKQTMMGETLDRYDLSVGDVWKQVKSNIEFAVWKSQTISILLLFLSMLIISIILNKGNILFREYTVVYYFSLSWVLLETHKLTMTYLPQRYLLGVYLAAGIFASLVLLALFKSSRTYRPWLILIIIIVSISNIYFYTYEVKLRTYDLREVRHYFRDKGVDNRAMLGSWAGSFAWGTDALTKPVWYGLINDKDPVNIHQPLTVISEYNESESDRAYVSQDIDLAAISDSVRFFDVWRYRVGVYWIKQDNSTD